MAFLANFQREHHAFTAIEAERHQGVGDVRPHPVGKHQVGAAQTIQVGWAALPLRGVVGFAAPLEVAHIIQVNMVAVDPGLQQLGDIVSPYTLV